jgi:recombination protein RecA
MEENNLESLINKIEKTHGKGSIMLLDSCLIEKIPVVSTGCLSLDIALGVGGFPIGRIVEIFGPESSGKTTLTLHAIAEVQKKGGLAAFIDAEHAFDKVYAKKIGVNMDKLLLSQPDYGEQALEIADTLAKSGMVDLIVIDSVAALVPKVELEGEMGDSKIGLQARLMSQALRKLTANISKSNSICIFINQLREKIGVMFGNPETTSGGNALKFYSSIRLDIRKVSQIKDSQGEAKGCRTRIKIVKNKVAPPFKSVEFDIIYGEGICKYSELTDIAIDLELIKKNGSWYSYKEEKIGQGKESVKKFIEQNDEISKDLINTILKINNL